MIEPTAIFDDERPIQAVVTMGEDYSVYIVGHGGVTKITPYREVGQMTYIPWLAVYAGDDITARVNCAGVESITYGTGDNQ